MKRKNTQRDLARDLAGLAAMATFTWDARADHAVLSARAQDLLGVSSPISTDDFFGRVHPDDRVRYEAESISLFEAGGEQTRAFRFIRGDGAVRQIMTHAMLDRLEGERNDRISGIFIDVTDDRLHDAAPPLLHDKCFGAYEFDVQTGTSVWTPSLQRMFLALSASPVTAEAIYTMIHDDDRDWVTARMMAIPGQVGPYSMVYRSRLPDGRTIRVRDSGEAHAPIDPVTGQVARVTGTLSDITAEMEGQDARRLANDAFWQLIDKAPIGAYAVDADLRIVRVSRAAGPAFAGIDNLPGRNLDEVLHILWPEPFATEAVARFRHTLDTGEMFHADPVIEDRVDRKVLEAYDWSVERIVLDDGRFGVLCYFYDLSKRVRNERLLEEQSLRLSLAYDAARMGAWEVDLKSGRTQGTPQLSALFGQPGFDGDISAWWQRIIHTDDRKTVDTAFAAAMSGDRPFDVGFRILTDQGETRHMAATGRVTFDAEGRPARMIGVNQDITERQQIDLALRISEERLRMILDHTLAFVGVLDPDGTLRKINQPALGFGGVTLAEVIGKPFWDTFWWTHSPEVVARCRQAVELGQSGQRQRFDVVLRGRGDRLITIDFMLAPIFDEDGALRMLVVSGMDISEREEARAHAHALMGEINHRTKNILTLVQVLARQTARGGAMDFVARFEARLGALATAQDLLFQNGNDRVDLRRLAKSQLGHFQDGDNSRITLTGPPVALAPDVAQAIGMALHELGTNAGKYGALSADKGGVDVAWDVASDDGTFTIRWSERGGPPVGAPGAAGFGSTVINTMTRSTFGADVQMDYAPGGLEWTLTCPAAALTGMK